MNNNNTTLLKIRKNKTFNQNLSFKNSLMITEEEKIRYFNSGNNYIEYFIEIGIKPSFFFQEELFKLNSIESINKKLVPEIISKFPNFNKKSVIIDNVIIKTVFPKGFKCIEIKNKPDPDLREWNRTGHSGRRGGDCSLKCPLYI